MIGSYGCYDINYFNSCAAIGDFVFSFFTGLTIRAELMKEKEKVRCYVQNEPSYLSVGFFSCVSFDLHYFHVSVMCTSIELLNFLPAQVYASTWSYWRTKLNVPTLPQGLFRGDSPVYESTGKRIFILIIFSINGKWHIARWKRKCAMFPCASVRSHYSCHNSLHNWLLIYFNTCVCSKWSW